MKQILIVLGLLSAGLLHAAPPAPANRETAVRRLPVRGQPVAVRGFERSLTVQGTLEAKRYASVAARVAGNLDEIWVDEGDAVKAGETRLFQIDPVSRRNQLLIATENLAVAQASLAVSRANAEKTRAEAKKAALDFARYTRLHEQARVSDNEYETHATVNAQAEASIKVADAQVALAERQVNQAEATLAIARKNVEDALAVAPLSGVVSARLAEPGEQMDVGRIILRIHDLSTIEAAAFLPAQYYPDVIPGKTRFRLEINGQNAGDHTVTYRSPTVNTTLRTFEIRGAVNAATGIAVPGSMAALTLIFETRDGLGVPSSSILVRGGKSVVFLVRDGKAVQAGVTTGFQNGAWTEILSGLKEGDTLVTEGQTQLSDGMAVSIL